MGSKWPNRQKIMNSPKLPCTYIILLLSWWNGIKCKVCKLFYESICVEIFVQLKHKSLHIIFPTSTEYINTPFMHSTCTTKIYSTKLVVIGCSSCWRVIHKIFKFMLICVHGLPPVTAYFTHFNNVYIILMDKMKMPLRLSFIYDISHIAVHKSSHTCPFCFQHITLLCLIADPNI